MPTRTASEREAFWRALENELPMFVDFLDKWEIPKEIQCERYGVKHFHNHDLVHMLRRTSPEGHLAELIDEFILERLEKICWEGTASELEAKLCAEKSPCSAKARKLLTHPNSLGTYLGRLERLYPHWISQPRTESGKTVWRIKNLEWIRYHEARMSPRQTAAWIKRQCAAL
jgi:hypothetical protein